MSLLFLSDQCVPAQITKDLAQNGHAVTLLRDVLPVRAPDGEVISKARERGEILVSLNGDFADIVAYPPAMHSGVIAIQLHNHPETIPQLMRRLHNLFAAHPQQQYYKGRLFIVEVHRIRVRQ